LSLPSVPDALSLASDAARAGDRQRARFIYTQILHAVPDEPNALGGLGVLLLADGALEAAEGCLRRALAACPHEAALHNNLYLVLRAQGRAEEAVECCQRALALSPDSPELHNNLGTALKAVGSLDAAADSFRAAIAWRPDYADAYYNLANTLVMSRRLDEGEAVYRRAVELAPRDCETYNNLGALLRLSGKLSEAEACFETALACRNDSVEAHHNRAVLRLLLGDFAQGWLEYEWRWRMPDVVRPDFSAPRWEGQPLAGRTILLWAEQGLGDTIQFIRYAPLVKRLGARVLVDCPPRLHALLATASGFDRFAREDAEQVDYQIPLVSLPARFGGLPETTASLVPYLRAERQRVETLRERLAELRGFKVGIAWQGSPGYTGDYYRSVPLARFAPLAACQDVRLISLQKGHGSEQLAPLAEELRIVDLASSLDEQGDAFVDTAAAMMNLDLVITSDTAVAHLAGALGVNAWVVLQQTPNWRWLTDRADTPWYPTMRLFRQDRLNQWEGVFARMAMELARAAAQARG
jgi:Flp pilus assembly protein TadD